MTWQCMLLDFQQCCFGNLGLKCNHQLFPCPWPWPWIFKGRYGICYISNKSGPIATKSKANISLELHASNVTNGFDHDHDLDLWISKVKFDIDLWRHKWPWPWIFIVKFWNSCISQWEGRLTLNKGPQPSAAGGAIFCIRCVKEGVTFLPHCNYARKRPVSRITGIYSIYSKVCLG